MQPAVYLLAAAPSGMICRQTLLSLPGLLWLCSEPSPQAQEVEEVSAESIPQGVQSCHVMRGAQSLLWCSTCRPLPPLLGA